MGEEGVGKGLPIRVKRARRRKGRGSSGFSSVAERIAVAAVIAVYWCWL